MTLFKLTLRELRHRRINFLSGVLSVWLATAVLSGALLLLDAYDRRTGKLLAAQQAQLEAKIRQLQNDTVRAMEHLGFNIVILPAGQNLSDWYADDYAAQTMPESSVQTLEKRNLVTIENLEPVLRRKIRWPETQWTVLIAGHGTPDAPPAGQADLGIEIARGLNLAPGSTFMLFETPFTVRRVLPQQAGVEDVTLKLNLPDAQQLLGMEGRISEIRAGQCRAAWQDMKRIREEIAAVLPGTQVIEKGSDVLAKVTAITQVEEKGAAQIAGERAARERMRRSVERTLGVLLPFILLACTAWIYLLAADNTARRTVEIGTLRSIGFSASAVATVFLLRSLLAGLIGGAAGLLTAAAVAQGMPLKTAFILLALAVFIALTGALLPVRRAVNRDPAEILRGDT
jgi:putative ABC transport system permease protein